MNERSLRSKMLQVAFIPVLVIAVSTSVAQGPPPGHGSNHDDRRDNGSSYHDNGYNHHDNGRHNGQDFHFSDQDRSHFAPHYQKDVQHWRGNPHGRGRVHGRRSPTVS